MPASREARPTIRFVDEYCQLYAGLFPEVRSFEAFKFLHLSLISQIKRQSLPAIDHSIVHLLQLAQTMVRGISHRFIRSGI